MEIAELFARLDRHHGSFPNDLVAEVIARQEEVIPAFLEVLEDVDRNPEPWLADEDRMIHIYAMYALALFRETRAYPLLVRIFSRPGRFSFELTGSVVTQDLGRILASVSGGDVLGIKALVEDEQANEYVRTLGMDALVSLVRTGQRTRDEILAYFLQLFQKFERKPGYQWSGLANACCDLWPGEAIGELRRAYEEGLVDPGSIAWQDVEHELALGQEAALAQALSRGSLITDLASDMSWMEVFHSSEQKDARKEVAQEFPFGGYAVATARRSMPKVGRNDPCPCGSGKKFKKCCGAN